MVVQPRTGTHIPIGCSSRQDQAKAPMDVFDTHIPKGSSTWEGQAKAVVDVFDPRLTVYHILGMKRVDAQADIFELTGR